MSEADDLRKCLAEMTALAMEGLIIEIDCAACMEDGLPRPETLDADEEEYCTVMIAAIRRTVFLIGIPDASASPYRGGGAWPAWLIDLIEGRRQL